MRSGATIFCLFISCFGQAQELFTWSEPASNMASKTIGFRGTSVLMKKDSSHNRLYSFTPEIMVGLSAKVMMHVEAFLDKDNDRFALRGGGLYFKYRFYSQDEIHSHLRMACFSRVAINRGVVNQQAIDINRSNSGIEAGLIGTKLMNKVAVSAGASFIHARDNSGIKFFSNEERNAIGYNLSIGKLMLPAEYVNYRQTNLNLIIELPGQYNPGIGKSYLDLAGALQLIILSRIRIDAGYRFAMIKDLYRQSRGSLLLRAEYTIFNVY